MPSQYVTAVRPSGSEISKKRPLSPDQDESADSSTEDVKIDLAHKEEQTIPSKKTLTFRIGDESQLDGFYCKTFLLLQQATMKLILKAWIKFIEPEKQKKWPYCLSSERRPKDSVKPRKTPDGKLQPPWWPEGVKHIEPDHLGKEGCHKLALVIIKMVQDQPECHGKGVQMLREETYKLNLRFDNEREDKYILRQYHLHQLFDVAAKQQDLIQGCIGTCL
jgi:hypothetical protein